jgi:hypothetical protein
MAAPDGADLIPDRFGDGYGRPPVERANHSRLTGRGSREVLYPPLAGLVYLADRLPEPAAPASSVVRDGKRPLASGSLRAGDDPACP